jgi:aspartyl-tRNA(Asn)/glutamyl-tRNA(Gln) amidotransferase subunit C
MAVYATATAGDLPAQGKCISVIEGLRPEEKTKLSNELGNILEYVKQLEALDTREVEPTSHVLNLENVFRKDEVKPSQTRDEALAHAPLTDGPFFKVPKTVERD